MKVEKSERLTCVRRDHCASLGEVSGKMKGYDKERREMRGERHKVERERDALCEFVAGGVNLTLCDRIVVQKVPGNRNYSDILVTKHNFYQNLLRRTTPKPNHSQNYQSQSWELVAFNPNTTGGKHSEISNEVSENGNSTGDLYSFNCTLVSKSTTKLLPVTQQSSASSSTKRTPLMRFTTSARPPLLTTNHAKRKKVIYVNPPIISAVETVLDSAYDMVEDALTTKKRIRLSTASPNVKKRTKKSPNGSKLITTEVHVTNEYEPMTQATIPISSDRVKISESSEEYYDDDFLYYDEEDDEDSEESEEDSGESPPVRNRPTTEINKRPVQVKPVNQNSLVTKKKKQRPSSDSSDASDYSDEDYDDEEYDDKDDEDFSLEDTFKYGSPAQEGGVFDYFGDLMSRLGSFLTSLIGLGGRRKWKEPSGVSAAPSTTPRTRRPKRPAQNYYDFHDIYGYTDEIRTRNNLENKEESHTTDSSKGDKGMWPDLGNWFGGDDSTTEFPESSTKSNPWYFNIFPSSSTTTSTTEKSTTTTLNPYDPGNFIALLAQHLVTTEAPEPVANGNIGQNSAKMVDYSNFQLWRLRPSNTWQVRLLTNLRESSDCTKCQWWKGPSLRGPTDLVVPPESLAFIEETLKSQGVVFEVVISDLQKAITYSNPRMTRREQYEIESEQGHPVTFYRYHRFDDIVKFLEFLQRSYPQNVELNHFGRSSEGLPLIMAKIFSGSNGTMELKSEKSARKRLAERKYAKPVVLIEAGSHGREWIAPAVAMWILNTLAQNIGQDTPLSEIYKSVDWLVVPVLNPDGYEFSHTHDRLWRKTRSKPRLEKGGFFSSMSFWNWFQADNTEESLNCTGVDLNRNWNYEWSKKGVTGKPCGDLYSGPKAFSEPESNALQNFVMKNNKRITVFLSLHAYGQMISVPKEMRGRSEDLVDMAYVAAQALHGHSSLNRYLVDDADEMLFPRPGAADAFMLNMAGIPYSYTLELRDTGTHGFLLPPSYIEATARDAFDIIKAIVDNL
ncbi:uncharacterized protein LOC132259231 [Phlebotomus argentipes]|uniref:uncharacterized protein LOC132259231 n=1 Tax=Phlebotomus argentipes TaxID=94469 RepID=UPI0028936BCC|nr:uncharacterized protein LOC132259231 [Phlebotomus argentipes]